MPLTTGDARDTVVVHEHRIDGLVLRATTVRGHAGPTAEAERTDVVLVHGLGASSATFEHLARHLARRSTVHVLDLPGFGRLPRPAAALEVPDLARLVTRWAERVGVRRPVLVGHSMGAQVVVEAAASTPDVATGLLLLGPTTGATGRSAARQMLRLARTAVHDSSAARAVLLRDYVRCGPRWYLAELRAMLRHRVEDRLPDVRVPVLVVRGAHDRVAPDPWVRQLAALAPQGRAVTVGGAGHAVMFDRAGEVAHLMGEHLAV